MAIKWVFLALGVFIIGMCIGWIIQHIQRKDR
jgi:hypothetical protein